jgi:predicted AAA+ superfamily ATPase
MFQRSHFQLLTNRIQEPRKHIQVIIGPRQVGKTTLLRQILAKTDFPYSFISADETGSGNILWLENQWEAIRFKMKVEGISSYLFVVDEIQKVQKWSEIIKAQWDADTNSGLDIKLVILGSSRLLIQDGLTESLAGRFETIHMGHWSYNEMHEAFGWTPEQFVWFGGYPGSAELITDEKRWKSYVRESLIETCINKDILMMTRVDKPALMIRLFEVGCLYSSQILSFNKILGQLQDAKNTVTLSHYLKLLDTAGMVCGLEKYSPNIIRHRASSPKFQVHNTALLSAQHRYDFQEIKDDPKEWGRILESSIGAHLLNHSFASGYKIFYWRDGNDEIDFVIEKNGTAIGLEVKSNKGKNVNGMMAFKNKFNPEKNLLIGESGIPWTEFIKIDPIQLF